MIIALVLAATGPISKFDAKTPDFDYTSASQIFDVERCLIDTAKTVAPHVYRQPDRPDVSTIMYIAPSGTAGGRIDLIRTSQGTQVRAWDPPHKDAITRCAPPTPAKHAQ